MPEGTKQVSLSERQSHLDTEEERKSESVLGEYTLTQSSNQTIWTEALLRDLRTEH